MRYLEPLVATRSGHLYPCHPCPGYFRALKPRARLYNQKALHPGWLAGGRCMNRCRWVDSLEVEDSVLTRAEGCGRGKGRMDNRWRGLWGQVTR